MKLRSLKPNDITPVPPNALVAAFNHVREKHPDVTLVVFNRDGRWQYMDEVFGAPVFGENIDVGILEDALAAVEDSYDLPVAFEVSSPAHRSDS